MHILHLSIQYISVVSESGDAASNSSSSASPEPSCTQLLNHKNSYHHVIKNEENSAQVKTITTQHNSLIKFSDQETNSKVQPVQLTFRNPPENYFFMTWNWPLIRKISAWLFFSGMVALLALVIAMIAALPKKCNPSTQWYQGGVLYEIFPASFLDTNMDSAGDFNGIARKVDYLANLGVRGVRLNSIFESHEYPEDYKNLTSFTKIAPQLGTLEEFKRTCSLLRDKNISVLLDLHLKPLVKQLPGENVTADLIGDALQHWTKQGVDGFYLKDLEFFVSDSNFPNCIRKWKGIVGTDRAIIVSMATVNMIPAHFKNILLNHVDLIDYKIDIEGGVTRVSQQIESVLNGTLFRKPGMPWVQWSLSNEDTTRLASRLSVGNGTLGATLLQLMLPGTPSIFYGDEIGLPQLLDPNGDSQDLRHLHQLLPMDFEDLRYEMMPHYWLHGEKTKTNFTQLQVVAKMVALRSESPAVYMNSIYKDGESEAGAEVKYSKNDLLVLQRWYPRRKSYVVVSNLGKVPISSDLSTLLYSGQVVVGPQADSESGSISFTDVSLWPGESVIVALD